MSTFNILEDIKLRAVGKTPIGSTLKLVFGEGEVIHLDGTGAENHITVEDKEADCLVHVKKEDMVALLTGKQHPMTAFMMGKLQVKGDLGVAMKLQGFLG